MLPSVRIQGEGAGPRGHKGSPNPHKKNVSEEQNKKASSTYHCGISKKKGIVVKKHQVVIVGLSGSGKGQSVKRCAQLKRSNRETEKKKKLTTPNTKREQASCNINRRNRRTAGKMKEGREQL